MRTADFTLYQAALAADREFTAAVIRQFGVARAGDCRYLPQLFDEGTAAAANRKHLADEAWIQELHAANAAPDDVDVNETVVGRKV